MDFSLPVSCAICAVNGGYIIVIPTWDEDGEPCNRIHSFSSLANAMKFMRATIEGLDSQAKTADDESEVEAE